MALRSMTGYGSGSSAAGKIRIDAEIRSVNSRFLDLSCRLPQLHSALEPEISKLIRERVARGRLELSVSRTSETDKRGAINFNKAAFEELLAASKEAFSSAGADWQANLPQLVLSLLERREVLEPALTDEGAADGESALVLRAVDQALAKLLAMRDEEGRSLLAEIKRLHSDLTSAVGSIETHAKAVPATFAERLKARLAKLPQVGEIDPIRLAQEAAILAERTDITEEIARLKSHLGQFEKYLAEATAGKKLDFLIQELGREFNTVGAKVQNSQVAIVVVEAKSTLEKIREQIQNVE